MSGTVILAAVVGATVSCVLDVIFLKLGWLDGILSSFGYHKS